MNSCLLCDRSIDENQNFFHWFTNAKNNPSICLDCLSKFEIISNLICPECGRPQVDNKLCNDCKKWFKQKDAISLKHRAIYSYNEFAHDYFQKYKFNGDYRLGTAFQSIIEEKLPKNFDVYTAIPVSEHTLKTRGFNQTKRLFDIRDDILFTDKKFQQSNNNRSSRININNPFKITEKGATLIKDKRVMILDDIYTTGTTLRMAAKIIKNAGAKTVNSFSLMR